MSLPRRIANLFSRSRIQQDIDAELRSHIDMRTADNVANGMSPEAAHRDALLRFGNPTAITERTTSADTTLTLASIASDIRFGIRNYKNSPASRGHPSSPSRSASAPAPQSSALSNPSSSTRCPTPTPASS